tara:strand:- start:27973 stop:28176 length:204 start_codon:yes stop_codon:yes gene_type:complete
VKKIDKILGIFDKAYKELDIFITKTSAEQSKIEDKQSALQLDYDLRAMDISRASTAMGKLKEIIGEK